MTDSYNTLTVVLENDIRTDDAIHLLNAIKMLKGVLAVNGNVSSPSDYMATERAKNTIRQQLKDVIWP